MHTINAQNRRPRKKYYTLVCDIGYIINLSIFRRYWSTVLLFDIFDIVIPSIFLSFFIYVCINEKSVLMQNVFSYEKLIFQEINKLVAKSIKIKLTRQSRYWMFSNHNYCLLFSWIWNTNYNYDIINTIWCKIIW